MELRFPTALQGQLAVFLLVLFRVGGLFAIAPFFSGPTVPPRVKVLFAAGITLCLAPTLGWQGPTALAALSNPGAAMVAVLGEIGIGVMVGFFVAVVIGIIQTAGHYIAQEMGMTVASVIDPVTSIRTSVVGQMFSSFAILAFILLDFHQQLIRLLSRSFEVLPLGHLARGLGGDWAAAMRTVAEEQGTDLYHSSVQLAMPFTVTLLLVTVAMAFLARAVPEMNIFVLGFTIRILVGLGILILLFPIVAGSFEGKFQEMLQQGAIFVRSLGGS